MLAIGDKVVYPMHGAGIIAAIEEHEILGQRQEYYILTLPYGDMRVMIPMKNVENIGIREIIGEREVTKVADILRSSPININVSWNKRFNLNMSKIKSGSIYEVAEVVRNLIQQEKDKKLSTGERRLLDTAKNILISELVLVCHKDVLTMEKWINKLTAENTSST